MTEQFQEDPISVVVNRTRIAALREARKAVLNKIDNDCLDCNDGQRALAAIDSLIEPKPNAQT